MDSIPLNISEYLHCSSWLLFVVEYLKLVGSSLSQTLQIWNIKYRLVYPVKLCVYYGFRRLCRRKSWLTFYWLAILVMYGDIWLRKFSALVVRALTRSSGGKWFESTHSITKMWWFQLLLRQTVRFLSLGWIKVRYLPHSRQG